MSNCAIMRNLRWAALAAAVAASCERLAAAPSAPEAVRILPGEYADGGKTTQQLPAAWGIHFGKDEPWKIWKHAWLHVVAEKEGTVSVSVNRQFEPIGPEKADIVQPPAFTPNSFPVKDGANWIKVPVTGLREIRFEVACDAAATCDIVILAKEDAFDAATLSAEAVVAIPRRKPRTEFADQLFERNPLMPLRDYAAAVARRAGVKIGEPQPTADANGAALYRGKPYFPMMMYHATCNKDEHILADVPLNVFGDRTPREPSPYPRLLMDTGIFNRNYSYDEYFYGALWQAKMASANRTAILYLADEPDGVYDAIGLRRLHELAKAAAPGVPTCYCFCTFAAVDSDKSRTCDFPCVDHYPIGSRFPWMSVQAIGWTVDKERLRGGNAPSFFTVQTYDYCDQMPYEGTKGNPDEYGFPTERELAAMTFLPVAHGARGLFFYNFREIHGKDQKSMAARSPETWATVTNLIMQLHVMEPALVGPEVRMPWNAAGEGSARLLVSDDRKTGYFLAVNPTLHAITKKFSSKDGNPLARAKFSEIFNYGVKADFAEDGGISMQMEALGSVLYRLSTEGLALLEKRTHEEIMDELRRRSAGGPPTEEAKRLGRRGQKRPAAPERKQNFERQ